MSRPIDADALVELCDKMADLESGGVAEFVWKQFRATVIWQPTIDAVPVVRCKDCIYWWESHRICKRNKDKNHHCACMDCDADFFCKNAERRTDD